MEIYVHSRDGDGLKLVEVEPQWTLDEFLAQSGAPEGADVWLEDGGEPLRGTSKLAERQDVTS